MAEMADADPAGPPTRDGRSYAEALTGSPSSGLKGDRPTGDVNPETTKTHDKPLTLANDFVNEVIEKQNKHTSQQQRDHL